MISAIVEHMHNRCVSFITNHEWLWTAASPDTPNAHSDSQCLRETTYCDIRNVVRVRNFVEIADIPKCNLNELSIREILNTSKGVMTSQDTKQLRVPLMDHFTLYKRDRFFVHSSF